MTVARIIDFTSSCVVLLAIAGGAVSLVASRRLEVALVVLLDLLTAAGLLHLAAAPTFRSAVFAGIVLVVRHVVGWGLRRTARHMVVRSTQHVADHTNMDQVTSKRTTA